MFKYLLQQLLQIFLSDCFDEWNLSKCIPNKALFAIVGLVSQLAVGDPSYLFGINIGGIEQKKVWKENYKGYDSVNIFEVDL